MSILKPELKIEMLPTSAGRGLSHVLPDRFWQRIRRRVKQHYGGRCAVCAGERILQCHEVWDYDETNDTRVLRDLWLLCRTCHMASHSGCFLAGMKGKRDCDCENSEYFEELSAVLAPLGGDDTGGDDGFVYIRGFGGMPLSVFRLMARQMRLNQLSLKEYLVAAGEALRLFERRSGRRWTTLLHHLPAILKHYGVDQATVESIAEDLPNLEAKCSCPVAA